MKQVILIENSALAPPGRLAQALERNGVAAKLVSPRDGEAIPVGERPSGWVILGAEFGAYETAQYPFLLEEEKVIRQAVEQDTPLLGICLGAQLIAQSMGGKAFRSPKAEAGVVDLYLTEAGDKDPVIGPMVPTAFTLHQDTFELPPAATLLARSELYPQTFRIGSALGIQFHPETPAAIAISWGEELGSLLREARIDHYTYCRRLREHDPLLSQEADSLFDRWIATLPEV